MNDIGWFDRVCRGNGIVLTEDQKTGLDKYVGSLLDWNQKINLISRKDEENVWESHILASVSILFQLKFPEQARVLDIGTGGGLPGIPLAIFLPGLKFTLVDATLKKVNAVKNIIQQLGLKNVEAMWGRAEELQREKNLKGRFDIAISRAVGPMIDLVKWSKPFLKAADQSGKPHDEKCIAPGSIVMMKGGDLGQELMQLKMKFKMKYLSIVPLTFSGLTATSLVDKKAVIVIS